MTQSKNSMGIIGNSRRQSAIQSILEDSEGSIDDLRAEFGLREYIAKHD